jgi:hypothetical protein
MSAMGIREIRSLGRCRTCKRAHRIDGLGWRPAVTCTCGATVKLAVVQGWESPDVKCGALCRNATGPSCDCSCAGANHGSNH